LPKKVREVSKALLSKGFREEKRDHRYYLFYYDGKKSSVYTKISHSETEISNSLCSAMARQMRLLGRSQFNEFADCSLSEEAYAALLIEGKHLQPTPTGKKARQD
jgi:hypothetical protein